MTIELKAKPSALCGLDHLMTITDSAEEAGNAFENLGFDVQPLGRHQSHGTSNRLIIFQNTYFELMGVDFPTDTNRKYKDFANIGGGIMAIGMRSGSAESGVSWWRKSGLQCEGALNYRRDVEIQGENKTAKFVIAHLAKESEPGIGIFICQHDTPEFVYRKEWTQHPNTACGVTGVTIVTPSPRAHRDGAYKAFGPDTVFDEGRDELVAKSHDSFTRYVTYAKYVSEVGELPTLRERAAIGAVAVRFAVRDMNALKGMLKKNNVGYREAGSIVCLPPTRFLNAVVEFQQVDA